MAKRFPTKYPGVYYIEGVSTEGKTERIYYIKYRRSGKVIEEPVGRQFRDAMSPARASQIRIRRIEGDELSNKEKRTVGIDGGKILDVVFEEYLSEKHFKKSTAYKEQMRYKANLKDTYGKRHVSSIGQKDFDAILRWQKEQGRAAQTIKHVTGILSRLVKFSAEKGYCQEQKIKLVLPRINNEKTEDLTPEQIKRLIEAMDSDHHPYAGKLMKMALFTGMRAGELFKLEWSDIDYERGFILIRDPKAGIDKKIPLNESVKTLLDTVHKMKQSSFVFPSQNGQQRTTIQRQADRIKKAAGLPKDFRPIHGLRHVFASALASSGQVDMYTLQKLLTHSDPKTTQRYAHLRDDALKNAADLAGKIFNSTDHIVDVNEKAKK